MSLLENAAENFSAQGMSVSRASTQTATKLNMIWLHKYIL